MHAIIISVHQHLTKTKVQDGLKLEHQERKGITMSLNELFMQILESEQKARERKDLLNELKSKISGVQQELQAAQTETNTLHSDLATKLQELCTEELECQWICAREAILEEQLQEQMKEKKICNEQLQRIKSERDMTKDDFQSNLSVFIHDFGLTSRGKEERLASVKGEVKQMKVRQKELQEDIDICNKQKDMLKSIEDEKTATEHLIRTLKNDIKDLEDALVSEKMKTKKLEEDKALVSSKLHTDPEFKRLQTQLEACRDESLEALCLTLRQQIDQLQRQQWQQQLRRQHPTGGGRPQQRFKWTVQPSVSRVQPTSASSWSNSHPPPSVQCARKTPMITTPEMGIKSTTSSTSTSSSTKPSVPSSSGKPNLTKLTNALKSKMEENQ